MNADVKNQDDIKILVDSFCKRAGNDELLGTIFTPLKSHDPYKEALYRYWGNTLLNPYGEVRHEFPSHIGMMSTPQHFVRWSRLFMENIDTLYQGPNAEEAKAIVIRKSEEFQTSLVISRF